MTSHRITLLLAALVAAAGTDSLKAVSQTLTPSFADELSWIRSTSRLQLVPAPRPPLPLDSPPYRVFIPGTEDHEDTYLVRGFTGRLSNGQEVMVVPLSGGGATGGANVYALVFTRLAGTVHYVGYLQSPNGHLVVSLTHGQVLATYPIFGPQGDNCCPPKTHYETYTLHGTHLYKVDAWIKNNTYSNP